MRPLSHLLRCVARHSRFGSRQDTTKLHALFARAPVLQISNRPRSSSKPQAPQVTAIAPYAPSSGSTPGSALPAHLAGAPLAPTVSNGTFVADPPKKKDRPPVSTLKITKVGLLSRKDDLTEGGKKAASRKWRGWSVVLTGSQLLFFVRLPLCTLTRLRDPL